MEQKPIGENEPFLPPNADVAKAYLDEAATVGQRVERRINRRSMGALYIFNACATAVFLTLAIVALRGRQQPVYQVLFITFIIWGQLAAGITARSGIQWRLNGRRWRSIVGIAVLAVAVVALMGAAVFVEDDATASRLLLIPGALVFVSLGVVGVYQLWRSRGDQTRSDRRDGNLPLPARAGTIAVGVLLGGVTSILAFDEGPPTGVLLLLVLMVLVAWMFASRTGLGLSALGEEWRWPQLTAFGLSAAAIATISALLLHTALVTPLIAGITGGSVALLLVLSAFIGGYRGR